MKKYIIITDSCSDLSSFLRDKYNIAYVCNTYSYDNITKEAKLDFSKSSVKEFYDIMRSGKRILTSQVSELEYEKTFEKAVIEGYDILSISVSSALSSSYYGSIKAKNKLIEKYPNSKILCVDSLNSSLGLGLLCIRASELRNEEQPIEAVYSWLEKNKLTMLQEATVDKLIFLKQSGRISATSAFFGGLLNVKPIIISDVKGRNVAIEKVKGRKTSFERIAQRIKERISDVEYQKIMIAHADCEEEAIALKEIIEKELQNSLLNIELQYIGPIVGASVGPGTINVYFYGEMETYDLDIN